jgi:hypothetical protein
MRTILTALLLSASTLVSACTKEETKPETVVEPKVKRVCIMVYDAKEKKEVEKCRVIAIYEKHEGTPIPKR